jgi:hypothetical protein
MHYKATVLDAAVVWASLSYLRSDKIGQDNLGEASSVSFSSTRSEVFGRAQRMTIDQTVEFRLDDEKRARVRDCLAKEGVRLPTDQFKRLMHEIENSIATHLDAEPEGTDRVTDDALAELWTLSHEDDPSVYLLRAGIRALPRRAADYIDRRFPVIFNHLFSTEPPAGGFQEWAATADAQNLVSATQVLSAEGGQWVAGRSRGGGKRSGPKLEPSIRGQVRGTGSIRRGGRPERADLQELILQLYGDWLHATEGLPRAEGRGDHTGFGDLVHSVFQWIGESEETATYALRRYWEDRSAH